MTQSELWAEIMQDRQALANATTEPEREAARYRIAGVSMVLSLQQNEARKHKALFDRGGRL